MPDELTEGIARRFLADAGGNLDPLASVAAPTDRALLVLPEVQNAMRSARESAESAIAMGGVINRLVKRSEGKSLNGSWAGPAVDSLRSALLFASAGVDTSLKSLVRRSLPALVNADLNVDDQFRKWAEVRISDGQTGSIKVKELVQLLLTRGATPRDTMMGNCVYALTDGSAQSSERVSELAQALGVTDSQLRTRASSPRQKTKLQRAFEARNEIAHELDVREPQAEVRRRLEQIRRYRSREDITLWCCELLDVAQLIINDVAGRMPVAAGEVQASS